MMGLSHPTLLAIGGMLLAIPIVLHFLMQRKPKHIVFPALQFVRSRQSSNQRKLQMRHFLLLMLRCILIALVALAFAGLSSATNLASAWLTVGGVGLAALVVTILLAATLWLVRPLNWWLTSVLATITLVLVGVTGSLVLKTMKQGKDVVISHQREPVAAVMLFDTGPQMMYRFENQNRIEKSKEIAGWVMSQLPLESEVSICDSRSTAPLFSVDISAARKRMTALTNTFLAIPITEQIRKCFALAQTSEKKQREIYIFTDLSLTAWRDANQAEIKQLIADHPQTHLYVIDVSAPNPTNFSLGEVAIKRSSSIQAKAVIQTELHRLGEAGNRIVQIEIERHDPRLPARRDGKTIVPERDVVNSAQFTVAANSSTPIELPIAELQPGLHHGVVKIVGQDGLAVDNERYFSIDIHDKWPVLVVSPKAVSRVDIVGILEQNRTTPLDITSIDQGDLAETKTNDYDAIFLLDPKPLSDSQWGQLHRFVERGGSLAIFLGSQAADTGTIHPSFQTEIAKKLLPGLQSVWRVDDDPVLLSPTKFNHPILQPLQGYATTIPWSEFPIKRFWGLDSDRIADDEASEIVLRFSNRRPAIIDRKIGQGRVVLWTTPVTEPFRPEDRSRWNDLLLDDCWPTWWLLRNTAEHVLANKQERINYSCGESAVLSNDPNDYPPHYQMFPPENEEPDRAIAQDRRLVYPFVDQPGVYRLKGRLEKPIARGFSANLSQAATHLSKISNEQLTATLGSDNFQLARKQSEIKRQQGSIRQGREFYPILILMLVLFFGLEQLMANWFYKA